MLRGAIDHIHPDRVSGWIYSDAREVRGSAVLAFIDGFCVGTGEVGIFREDLLRVGLGDGHLGFSFGITPLRREDISRIYVKIAGSDFILISPSAYVAKKSLRSGSLQVTNRNPASFEWMRKCGWLEPEDYDFLKYFNQFGVFDRSLRLSKNSARLAGRDTVDGREQAKALFELLLLREVMIEERRITSPSNPTLWLTEALGDTVCPVVAILADVSDHILVLEGSHMDEDEINSPSDMSGAVEYAVESDRIVILSTSSKSSYSPITQPPHLSIIFPI